MLLLRLLQLIGVAAGDNDVHAGAPHGGRARGYLILRFGLYRALPSISPTAFFFYHSTARRLHAIARTSELNVGDGAMRS